MAKLTPQQLGEVCMLQEAVLDRNRWMRSGQAFVMALAQEHEDLVEEITNKEFDPYYDDDKLTACKKYLLGGN